MFASATGTVRKAEIGWVESIDSLVSGQGGRKEG